MGNVTLVGWTIGFRQNYYHFRYGRTLLVQLPSSLIRPISYSKHIQKLSGFPKIPKIEKDMRIGLLRGAFNTFLRGSHTRQTSPSGLCTGSQLCYSTMSFDEFEANNAVEEDDFISDNRNLEPQGVDPKRGWGFRGVHKAIICGKIGQAPVQKILRNGRTVTIFTVGTGGMFDQRISGAENLPKPAQWHRITVHNEFLGAYAVQQLVKESPVFVEGDIETRVYNDSINGQVKTIPEICVRRDGKIRLIKTGENSAKISLDDLRDGLF